MTTQVSRIGLAIVVLLLTGSGVPADDAKPGGEPQRKIGEIIIVGNDVTDQEIILRAVGLASGQILRYADLQTAEKNLEKLHLFATDPRPTVCVVDPDGPNEFKEILVTIQETSTRRLRLMRGLTPGVEPVISIVWEERNFDLSRLPTSLDDLASGHAFRGRGQLLRLELLQIPLLPCRPPRVLQLGSILLPINGSNTPPTAAASGG